MEEIRERAREIFEKKLPCVICESNAFEGQSEEQIYTHLLEHRVRFLVKIIQLYCDCDCDTRKKPAQDHWMFCRRKIGDEAIYATLEQMVPSRGK